MLIFLIQCLKFANYNIFLGAMKDVATGRHSTVSRKAKIVSNDGSRRTRVSTFSLMDHSVSLIKRLIFHTLKEI